MPRRLAASSALALALSLPALALADVPPADAGPSADLDCTAENQSRAGTTCAECVISTSDTSCQVELGGDYNFACQYSPTVQVWCNGPPRTATPSPGCSLRGASVPAGPAGSAGLAAVTALLGVAAWSMRRRRR